MSRWAPVSWWSARDAVRVGAGGVLDVLHPLLVMARGLGRLAALGRAWWARTPRERKGPGLLAVATCGVGVWLLPYGPALAGLALAGAAAWYGRERGGAVQEETLGGDEVERLHTVYEALVPYFAREADPAGEPLYAYDGTWERAVVDHAFRAGRLSRLLVRYPAFFPDGEPGERLRIERVLAAKAGRGREYRFGWDEERNLLEMTALEPLPTGIPAQPFVTGPGETVLGFTDGAAVRRTVPVLTGDAREAGGAGDAGDAGELCDVPPVVWRTGPRSTESHLLVVGTAGAGASSLVRSVALQALRRGEVVVVDGDGGGGFSCLAGRRGVLGVESSLTGALASLEWVVRETERRLLAASRARQHGAEVPQDARSPLWVLLDRPAVLSHLARAEGRPDPQELLRVPLRHGRAAGVTVVVAEQFEAAEELTDAVLAYPRARVVLGATTGEQVFSVLGASAPTGPVPETPAGRGFARLGTGPVLRLQVPATPDPSDETARESERAAVRALLPEPVRAPGAGQAT